MVVTSFGLSRKSDRGLNKLFETVSLLGTYIFLYDYLYVSFLSPRYAYMGFVSQSGNVSEFVFACSAIFLAPLILPTSLKRFSDYFLWFMFSFGFIPGVLTVARMGTFSDDRYILIFLLTISLFLLAVITRSFPSPFVAIAGHQRFTNVNYLILITVGSLLALVVVFHSIMGFSTIETIYDQRAQAGGFGAGRLTLYFLTWTPYAFLPLLFAIGIRDRRWGLLLFSCVGFLIIFMINGAKIVFVIPAMMVGVNYLFSRGLARRPGRLLTIPIASMIFVWLIVLVSGTQFSTFMTFLISQLFMRALAIQAVMLGVYAEFFSENPLTYMSHVTGISALIDYPYSEPIGYVVGKYLVGGDGFNANAGFWATDGIAAFGLIGIPIASVLVGFLLVFINMVSARSNPAFIAVVLTPFCLTAVNTSFFTALITGGGFVAAILCAKLPKRLGV